LDILGVNSTVATPAPSYHSHLNPETDVATLETARNPRAPAPAALEAPNDRPGRNRATAGDGAPRPRPKHRSIREVCADFEWYKVILYIWVTAVIMAILFALANLIMFFSHRSRHTNSRGKGAY
jgi:hypothetical protein